MNREREQKFECVCYPLCRGVNIVILNWQKPLWKGDQEVVKRSGRHEPMWVAIYKYMEAMPGIFLYSYLSLKLAKTCLSYYLPFYKTREQGTTGSAQKGVKRRGEVAQTMYTHVSKCKNDKIFFFARFVIYQLCLRKLQCTD
jgi:hypothetical protein